ncbi:hypothetical protein Bca4012_065590 [Brassica carinata]
MLTSNDLVLNSIEEVLTEQVFQSRFAAWPSQYEHTFSSRESTVSDVLKGKECVMATIKLVVNM